jgi:hypothetical protein
MKKCKKKCLKLEENWKIMLIRHNSYCRSLEIKMNMMGQKRKERNGRVIAGT